MNNFDDILNSYCYYNFIINYNNLTLKIKYYDSFIFQNFKIRINDMIIDAIINFNNLIKIKNIYNVFRDDIIFFQIISNSIVDGNFTYDGTLTIKKNFYYKYEKYTKLFKYICFK